LIATEFYEGKMKKYTSIITVSGQMRGESWRVNSINKYKEVKSTMKKFVSILIVLIFIGVILLKKSIEILF
jgi:hypothetical protein